MSKFMRLFPGVFVIIFLFLILIPNSIHAQQDCKELLLKYKDWITKKPKGPSFNHTLTFVAVSNSPFAMIASYTSGRLDKYSLIIGGGTVLYGKGKRYTDKPYWGKDKNNPFNPKKAKDVKLSINIPKIEITIGETTIADLKCKNGLIYGFIKKPPSGFQRVIPMYIISIRPVALPIPE
jgi:hypothetical protein